MSAHVSLCSLPCFIICFSHLQDLPSDFVLSVPREGSLQKTKRRYRMTSFVSAKDSPSTNTATFSKCEGYSFYSGQDPHVIEVAGPSWPADLHLGNISVSSDDPTLIESMIDWQSVQIAPLFVQGRFPEFLRTPNDNNPGAENPSLPDNFEESDLKRKSELSRRRHCPSSRNTTNDLPCIQQTCP
jgi:hypothetical protein